MSDLRNYGLPNSEVLSTPVATPLGASSEFSACPNCGCEQMMKITVTVSQELLSTETGTGTYLGCPACPFASPMMIIADKGDVSG